jgi:hypothetical protein
MVLNRRNAKVRQSIFGCGTSVTMIHVQIQVFVCVMSLFMFLLEFLGKGESSNTVRLVYRRGYSPKPDIHKLGAAMRGGSVSSSSTIKWCKESSSIVRNVNITSSIATEITNYNSTASSNNATTDTTTDANKISTSTTVYAETLQVTKLNGTLQKLQQPFVSVAQQVLSSQSKFYNPIHGEGVMSRHGMAPPVVPRLYK